MQRAYPCVFPPLTCLSLSPHSPGSTVKIFILIVDRLTATESPFSTPSPRPFDQSAHGLPAILVHAEAARTCTILLHLSLHPCGSPRSEGCASQMCVLSCIRVRVCVREHARTFAHRGRVFPLENRRLVRKLRSLVSAPFIRE